VIGLVGVDVKDIQEFTHVALWGEVLARVWEGGLDAEVEEPAV